jgi:hypothetical protein
VILARFGAPILSLKQDVRFTRDFCGCQNLGRDLGWVRPSKKNCSASQKWFS